MRRGAVGAVSAALLLAASIVVIRSDIIGRPPASATSFSLCEEALDGAGLPRDECQASDIRFEIDPAGPVDPADSDFGFSIATGNLNGDLYADIAVGDPRRNRVYLFYGRPSAVSAYGLDPLDLTDRMVSAETQADVILFRDPAIPNQVFSFGWAVAISREQVAVTCGSLDFAAPLLIGAPGLPGTTPNAPGTVFHLPAGSLCLPPVDPASPVTIDPGTIGEWFAAPDSTADDEFGYSVGFGRLLSNSGTDPDLVVGARNAFGGDGRVTILPATGGVVDLSAGSQVRVAGLAGDGLGEVMANGDLDQDFDATTNPLGDRDDMAIGAVGAANGKVVLVAGPLSPTGGMNSDGIYQEGVDLEVVVITGEDPDDYFGFSLDISAQGHLLVGGIFADNIPGSGSISVSSGDRINAGKAYLWTVTPDVLNRIGPGAGAASANRVYVGRRSGDHLGFGVAFVDADGSGEDDLVLAARREDGSGLTINEIDQGTAYLSYDIPAPGSPIDLNLCAPNSDCTGVGSIEVMLFGGDRAGGTGDEIGYVAAGGDWNGDGSEDLLLSSLTRKRVYLITLDDFDNDFAVEGRNIRDDEQDGDGDPDSTDCAPNDPAINSLATEIPCNGIDENCNGLADDVPDDDGDGFDACGIATLLDCDDDDPDSFPGAPELCDGNDNACLGSIIPIEFDTDGDGYVECTNWMDVQGDDPAIVAGDDCDDLAAFTFPGAAPNDDPIACMRDRDLDDWGDENPPGFETPGTDCGDLDATVFPGAAQIEDPGACMKDTDDDGWGDVAVPPEFDSGTDCDDLDSISFPGAAELCDGNDNACAGLIAIGEIDDDGDGYVECTGWNDGQGDDPAVIDGDDCDDDISSPSAADTFPGAAPNDNVPGACMKDVDGDDWGDQNPPAGVTAGFDCEDDSITTFRGAAPNDDPGLTLCMKDDDGDDWGDASPPGVETAGTDCDDADLDIFPAAAEIPDDTIDQDCNGFDTVTCFTDGDGDGFGTLPSFLQTGGSCADPGESAVDTDCDDNDPFIYPGRAEIPDDGIDQDCNGADTITCVVDADMDGAGTGAGTSTLADDGSCDAVDQESSTMDDCDDADPNSFPGAPELCDGNDNGCLGVVAVDETDVDGDTWVECVGWNDTQGDDAGIAGGGDCDETSLSALDTFPGAAPSDNVPTACMKDSDGDDFGDASPPPGVTFGGDCDDTDLLTFPGAAQIEASLTCMHDADDDGWGDASPPAGVPAGTDCDDADPISFPGAAELCDGNDNACGGTVPADEVDNDGDGFVECSGWSDLQGDDPGIIDGGDCDDITATAADTFPGAAPNDNVPTACMKDSDGDDWGDESPPGGVTSGFDCDDTSATTFRGAAPNDDPGMTLCMNDDDMDDWGDVNAPPGTGTAGTDCDDADPTEYPGQSWYADCDSDGAFRGTAVLACDLAAADLLTPCLDALPPDGGWTNTDPGVGADIDDENPGAQSGPPPDPQVTGISVSIDGIAWQLSDGSGSVNIYRGDLDLLRAGGLYTQVPDPSNGPDRVCGAAGTVLADDYMPEPGRAVFFLVTARTASGETTLGTDSNGAVRPNANPCP